MAGGFIGLDPEAVRTMASKFDAEKNKIQEVQRTLERLIAENIPQKWNGNDATQFKNEWDTQYKSALTRIQEELGKIAVTARKNAEEQTNTSNNLARS